MDCRQPQPAWQLALVLPACQSTTTSCSPTSAEVKASAGVVSVVLLADTVASLP